MHCDLDSQASLWDKASSSLYPERLCPIVTLENPSHNASMTMFLHQPTMYTATLHIAGCKINAVDAATLDLSSITESPGSCRVSLQGKGMYSLMGRYSCTMYDLICSHCNECTMKVSMIYVEESAICACFRKEHQVSLLTLSFDHNFKQALACVGNSLQ
jgi:hypothetical protein